MAGQFSGSLQQNEIHIHLLNPFQWKCTSLYLFKKVWKNRHWTLMKEEVSEQQLLFRNGYYFTAPLAKWDHAVNISVTKATGQVDPVSRISHQQREAEKRKVEIKDGRRKKLYIKPCREVTARTRLQNKAQLLCGMIKSFSSNQDKPPQLLSSIRTWEKDSHCI